MKLHEKWMPKGIKNQWKMKPWVHKDFFYGFGRFLKLLHFLCFLGGAVESFAARRPWATCNYWCCAKKCKYMKYGFRLESHFGKVYIIIRTSLGLRRPGVRDHLYFSVS